MNEVLKLAAASIVIKKAAPNWLNRFLGRPTQAMRSRQKFFKILLPLVGATTAGTIAYKNRDKIKDIVQQIVSKEPQLQQLIDSAGSRGANILTDLANADQLRNVYGGR
jgi:hypothetical protein